MSSAEIADNKWELQASKPPIKSAAGLSQIFLMSGFIIFFAWIIIFSIIAIVTPKDENGGWAGDYENLNAQGRQAAPAQPAEAAE